jgi:gamma-glutamyltranspeptidase/glutathione hydrolase
LRRVIDQTQRPNILGTQHVIVSGHYLASQAGFQILEAGGNAIDAGVAASIMLGVVELEMVNFAGVAPMILYLAETGEIVTISGLGGWPKAATCEYFQKHHGGEVPRGILRTVVPGAPDAFLTALERYGTMSFSEIVAASIRICRDGFVMYQLSHDWIKAAEHHLPDWPTTAAVFMPGGRVPEVGDVFYQKDLAATLQYLCDEEAAHSRKGRAAGIEAVRHAFYRGDLAQKIVRFHKENGGLISLDDMAGFRAGVEPAIHTTFGKTDVYGCGPWCQGPMLLQELNLVEGLDLKGMGHNSPAYLHHLTEAIKLAAADRDAYYGDPRFVDVPINALLGKDYAAQRRKLIDPKKAYPGMPAAGKVAGKPWPDGRKPSGQPGKPLPPGIRETDTSYACVVDRWGNAFSGTPSDGSIHAPIVPGTGFALSARGTQSWAEPGHPSSLGPGKRPRLTPNPALAIVRGEMVMPFGTPGGDVQTQVMLQVFLNAMVFEMDPQSAVEAARIATHSFPATHMPHQIEPASLYVQGDTPRETADALAALGHDIHWWPQRGPENTSTDINGPCLIQHDLKTGVKTGGADPRRMAYGLGW